MQNTYAVVIWYRRRGGRQRWLRTDFVTFNGALRYLLDVLPGWLSRPTLTVVPTIIERQPE